MRLKLYRAATVSQAMSQIRTELGVEALILATRRVADGVEVTAALDPEAVEAARTPAPPRAPVAVDPARVEALAFHGVPTELAVRLASGPLDRALAATLAFAALDLGAESRPVLLVGPPGAGKTLTAARLATRLVMGGAAPMVITADGSRAGATEQLAAFTRLLGLSLIVASHPVMLGRALARRAAGAPVLIDAPGCDPFDPAQRESLAALAATARAAIALVLPAGMDAAEAEDVAGAFRELGAEHLIATRLDLARRLGGVLQAARGARLALVEAGIGPAAADGLVPCTPGLLAARLILPPRKASP